MSNEKIMTDIDQQTTCIPADLPPADNSPAALGSDFQRYLSRHLGRFQGCDPVYVYNALSYTLRDRLMADWQKTQQSYQQHGVRRAYYMSLEFLIGRSLGNNLLNLGLTTNVSSALQSYCADLEEISEQEADAGLGNGGLGRLAACFMDSCATLSLPVTGYGIRYEYGMFRQQLANGYQIEEPDHWLRDGQPWEIERAEYAQEVSFGGHTEFYHDGHGVQHARWVNTHKVLAIPYDMPITGYKNGTVNTLRLWKATATDAFDLNEFNAGSYTEAVQEKNNAEHISMVLYPNDSSENGKELRLRQQYFLASASLQDAIRIWEAGHTDEKKPDYQHFSAENVFQMNDTHPTIAVAELMRILLDEKHLDWQEAWQITTQCMAYTNHTLLPEALERWPVHLFERLLPRLLDIIYEINARFLREVAQKWPGDTNRQQRMSIIEEGDVRQVRMAWLAIVGSFSVNGVAALHSQLLIEGLFRDFYELWPKKFNNKTNGVTPRRWIAHANPELTGLISSAIGEEWIRDLAQLDKLIPYAQNEQATFQQQWQTVKQNNKQRLARLIEQECGITVDTSALFDIQVKRIHEYKRQLLNVLHVIHCYAQIKQGMKNSHNIKRMVLIGGKAAPGYAMAKDIIKLINNVAEVINNDPEVGDQLKLVFFPNYRVSSMEVIAPAADLSAQISTAGKEASGTGNMKFMMNGALTIGTYDGANIEIMEAVGADNFFLFGLNAEEVNATRSDYQPADIINADSDLQVVINLLTSGHFNACEPGIFDNIVNALLSPHDPWLTLADFRSFIEAQKLVDTNWQDQTKWTQMSILNTARSGFFSTDRTMEAYNKDIWELNPIN